MKKCMRFLIRLFTAFMLLSVLAGCVTIRTNFTSYHGSNHADRGTIDVRPINDEQKGSLAFANYRSLLLEKLKFAGYGEARPNELPMFVAYMTYGVDAGKFSTTVVPIFGQTGGGMSATTGNITSNYGAAYNYNSTTTQMPTYGMIGAVPVRKTEYTRELNIDIYRLSHDPAKVYEIRAKSSGSCGNIDLVMSPMIESVFKKFPSISGKPQSVDIELKGVQC